MTVTADIVLRTLAAAGDIRALDDPDSPLLRFLLDIEATVGRLTPGERAVLEQYQHGGRGCLATLAAAQIVAEALIDWWVHER